MAMNSLATILASTTDSAESFTTGTHAIDYNYLPPFVTFLTYKAAALVTQRLWMEKDANEGLRKLRILRDFLEVVGQRWLSGSESTIHSSTQSVGLTRDNRTLPRTAQ